MPFGKKTSAKKQTEVSVIVVGDVCLARGVGKNIIKKRESLYPFLRINKYLKTSDILIGNFESSITNSEKAEEGRKYSFHAYPGVEKILRKIGFSAVFLANNHTPDFGERGIRDTLKYLKKVNIKPVGLGTDIARAYKPVYLRLKDIRLALLAFNSNPFLPKSCYADRNHPGTAFADFKRVVLSIRKAKKKSDIVIVSLHTGDGFSEKPNDFQINTAHAAIRAGAEMVIGTHPHIAQRAERYKGKYIFYSLGSFVFDIMRSRKTREGLIVKVIFTKKGAKRIEFAPIYIGDDFQPQLLEGKKKKAMFKRLDIFLAKNKP